MTGTMSLNGMNVVGRGAVTSRTVLITGVSKGLGRALAVELAKRGHVVIGCSRAQDKLDSLQSELSASSGSNSTSPDKHLFLNVDVRSNSSVEELARIVMEKKGSPDIIGYMTAQREKGRLVSQCCVSRLYDCAEGKRHTIPNGLMLHLHINNAGTINRNNKIWEVPVEEFDNVLDTNVKGIANVLRHFIPLMIAKKQGIIVNMSSGWGRSGAALVAPYCASKWAVEGLTKSVAKELPEGMAAVALNPGVINTELLTSCFGDSAALYQAPEAWALKATSMILNLKAADNGASLTV